MSISNVIEIITKKGYSLKIPMWKIGGLIRGVENGTCHINIVGSETYEIDEAVFILVEANYTKWIESVGPETISNISISERVEKQLEDTMASVELSVANLTNRAGERIDSIAKAVTDVVRTQSEILKLSTKNSEEVSAVVRDIAVMSKSTIKIAQDVLAVSTEATKVTSDVAAQLKGLSDSLKSIESLKLLNI